MLLCVYTAIFFIYFLNYAGDGESSDNAQFRDKMNNAGGKKREMGIALNAGEAVVQPLHSQLSLPCWIVYCHALTPISN